MRLAVSDVLILLFSAGGAAFLAAVVAGIRSLRSSRIETEEALIKRLNDAANQAQKDADQQRRRAERAERYADDLRRERDQALDLAARRFRAMIEAGLDDVDTRNE